MLPPERVLLAARRWLDLLTRVRGDQALQIIRTDASYTDLTTTQYFAALEWLESVGVVTAGPHAHTLATEFAAASAQFLAEVAMVRGLELLSPSWLADADVLVPDASDLPDDALRAANALDLPAHRAFELVQVASGKVDAARRAEVGLLGERALVVLLERCWPGCVTHVAAVDDGFGYDIDLRVASEEWHLEVKSTMRRGRLSLYLSRHEFAVSLADPRWRLVVLGLSQNGDPLALATVSSGIPSRHAPVDQSPRARWEAARFDLVPGDLDPGLPFIRSWPTTGSAVLQHGRLAATTPAWFPEQGEPIEGSRGRGGSRRERT